MYNNSQFFAFLIEASDFSSSNFSFNSVYLRSQSRAFTALSDRASFNILFSDINLLLDSSKSKPSSLSLSLKCKQLSSCMLKRVLKSFRGRRYLELHLLTAIDSHFTYNGRFICTDCGYDNLLLPPFKSNFSNSSIFSAAVSRNFASPALPSASVNLRDSDSRSNALDSPSCLCNFLIIDLLSETSFFIALVFTNLARDANFNVDKVSSI
mmetsp:Transcript_31533/g.38316  ORF Transcript_31533/g.38316 Transcript_31533/m.38316 type:complete len:210 (+) Transcript_31533:336-965(+)